VGRERGVHGAPAHTRRRNLVESRRRERGARGGRCRRRSREAGEGGEGRGPTWVGRPVDERSLLLRGPRLGWCLLLHTGGEGAQSAPPGTAGPARKAAEAWADKRGRGVRGGPWRSSRGLRGVRLGWRCLGAGAGCLLRAAVLRASWVVVARGRGATLSRPDRSAPVSWPLRSLDSSSRSSSHPATSPTSHALSLHSRGRLDPGWLLFLAAARLSRGRATPRSCDSLSLSRARPCCRAACVPDDGQPRLLESTQRSPSHAQLLPRQIDHASTALAPRRHRVRQEALCVRFAPPRTRTS